MELSKIRAFALIEGTTLLLLLFVAMPLKYKLDIPMAVSIMGPVHGIAFMLYLSVLGLAFVDNTLTALKLLVGAIAAFIPFGSFVFERVMLKPDTPHAASIKK
jgi:integral membrane protein